MAEDETPTPEAPDGETPEGAEPGPAEAAPEAPEVSEASGTDGDGGAEGGVELEELSSGADPVRADMVADEVEARSAQELEPVFDIPVKVQAVLGKSQLEVSQLLKLAPGAVIELDRKVGEAIDIYVNNRLVARGEVVLVEDHLGVTMTEIIKVDRS